MAPRKVRKLINAAQTDHLVGDLMTEYGSGTAGNAPSTMLLSVSHTPTAVSPWLTSLRDAIRKCDAWAAIRKKAKAAGFLTSVRCHTWRATGITIYLENDGRLEHAQQRPDMSRRGQPNSTIEQRTRLHSVRSSASGCEIRDQARMTIPSSG